MISAPPKYPIKLLEYYTYTDRGEHGCCSRDYFQTEGQKVLVTGSRRVNGTPVAYTFITNDGFIGLASADELIPIKGRHAA